MIEFKQGASENGYFIFSGCKINELETPSEIEGIDETSIKILPQTAMFIGSDTNYKYNPY